MTADNKTHTPRGSSKGVGIGPPSPYYYCYARANEPATTSDRCWKSFFPTILILDFSFALFFCVHVCVFLKDPLLTQRHHPMNIVWRHSSRHRQWAQNTVAVKVIIDWIVLVHACFFNYLHSFLKSFVEAL